jgi:hypothetical protein
VRDIGAGVKDGLGESQSKADGPRVINRDFEGIAASLVAWGAGRRYILTGSGVLNYGMEIIIPLVAVAGGRVTITAKTNDGEMFKSSQKGNNNLAV